MAGGYAWTRRGGARARALRGLLRDTHRALQDVADILHIEPETTRAVQDLTWQSSRRPALLLLGCSGAAVARLLHCLLARKLLPDHMPRGRRWVRVQYGSSTAVHLSVGDSEFELVEQLECNRRPWETLPVQDLRRRSHDEDSTTVLEVELNNQFLKDGLAIVIPPDIDTEPDPTVTFQKLKEIHSEFYAKRELILKNFNPIYLYAVDRLGKNIFVENLCDTRMVSSRSEEDFWANFNLYYMTRSAADSELGEGGLGEDGLVEGESATDKDRCSRHPGEREAYVFNAERCLELHQVKQVHRTAQLMFVLLADTAHVQPAHVHQRTCERGDDQQTLLNDRYKDESPIASSVDRSRQYEEQCAFMSDLLEQWELMFSPPPKHSVKSQWMIIDDAEIMRTADQKVLASYLSNAAHNSNETSSKGCTRSRDESKVVRNRTVLLSKVVKFAADAFQSYLLEYCTRLSEVHVKLLQRFILASFDLARELQVVPRKIQYVATREQHLYETITEKFTEGEKKQELLQIMQQVLQEMTVEVNNMDWSVDDLPCHQDKRYLMWSSMMYESSRRSPDTAATLSLELSPRHSRDRGRDESGTSPDTDVDSEVETEEAVSYDSFNFEDYEIIRSTDESLSVNECFKSAVDGSPLEDTSSIHIEGESAMSVGSSVARFTRSSVARLAHSGASDTCTNTTQMSMKQASLDVQKNVLNKLSRRISVKLVTFLDCLKDTYFGTLQRCLESLEWSCRRELGGRPASEAMRQLVSVARCVDLQPVAAFSLVRTLLDSLRRLFTRVLAAGGAADGACCVLSPVWRRQVAARTLHSLSAHRLARVISHQILERLCEAHERYQAALAALESALASRLHHTEDVKLAIRKKYAPSLARLCLESTSMCDVLMHGSPDLGREIGRGQYGVVYSVRGSWAGRAPLAVKSVVPADERHYHELAMEFFYTRSIPPHPRIVRLYGSVVSHHSGSGPSVLLVCERKCRDLHAAVRARLPLHTRMAIAIDIVEGIRYLHSLGLVHRDIKMKNVLLDQHDRASLTDLGFCALEALMSGSVVGTPVHMAPELLAGEYDANVDVYAFGILFWYLCAGSVKLPTAFEVFQNKEQLWSKVRRGLRPERLPHFSDSWWEVMEACWHTEPARRALLGDVQPRLEAILAEVKMNQQPATIFTEGDASYTRQGDDDESLYLTGLKQGLL